MHLFFDHAFHQIIDVFRLHLKLFLVSLIFIISRPEIFLVFLLLANFRHFVIAASSVYFRCRNPIHFYFIVFVLLGSVGYLYDDIAGLMLMVTITLIILVYPRNLWVSRYSRVSLYFGGECRWFWVLACYAVAHPSVCVCRYRCSLL